MTRKQLFHPVESKPQEVTKHEPKPGIVAVVRHTVENQATIRNNGS